MPATGKNARLVRTVRCLAALSLLSVSSAFAHHSYSVIDNCRFCIEHETYALEEIAARFHHKLVWIHCYPNGNGRHARFATDLLLIATRQKPFSWGSVDLVDAGEVRGRYISALQAADRNDIEPLLEFVRS
ncbi:MAG: mobile mystery protein B [Candidatus Rariloculaceae bacterium]